MRCSILEDRVAVWSLKNTHIRLSALTAELLVEKRKISWKQLRLLRHVEWNDFEGPGEPLTGGATAIMGTVTGIAAGVGSVPFRLARTGKKRARFQEKKKKRKSQQIGLKNNTSKGHASVSTSQTQTPVDNSGNCSDSVTSNNGHSDGSNTKIDKPTPPKDAVAAAANAIFSPIEDPTKTQDVTTGRNMSKHTSQGGPFKQKDEAIREEGGHNPDDESDSSDDPDDNTAEEMVQDVGSGFGRTAEALARAPMDLSLAVAQGFHNAPRLYGDTTVRRLVKIGLDIDISC